MPKPQQNKRKQNKKPNKHIWAIFCEGKETEVNYFDSLFSSINNKVKIVSRGVGRQGTTLVKDVIALCAAYENQKNEIIDKTFVVFDKDNLTDSNFNGAIKLANDNKMIPIWSNECFELWFVLHYQFYQAANSRTDYYDILKEKFGFSDDYENHKSDDLYSIIHTPVRFQTALKNAKKLDEQSDKRKFPAKRIPCTKIYELIEIVQDEFEIEL